MESIEGKDVSLIKKNNCIKYNFDMIAMYI